MRKTPPLYLAPMEGLGDRFFRSAMACIGGFDEASTEFIRIPRNAHIPSLSKKYIPNEIAPHKLAAQIMGQDPELAAEMTEALIERKAPRVDLNCGCPSNTVVGRGAGSNLLKTPDLLYEMTKAMVVAAKGRVPITVKMRAGYEDTRLLKENLQAAESAGAHFVTLHHRTKLEGYSAPIHWDRIAYAKSILKIPLIGSGDVLTPQDAERMLNETKCDGVMIGRGAARNPLIFLETKAYIEKSPFNRDLNLLIKFLETFKENLEKEDLRDRSQINKLKQITHHMLSYYLDGECIKKELLRSNLRSSKDFFIELTKSISKLEESH